MFTFISLVCVGWGGEEEGVYMCRCYLLLLYKICQVCIRESTQQQKQSITIYCA